MAHAAFLPKIVTLAVMAALNAHLCRDTGFSRAQRAAAPRDPKDISDHRAGPAGHLSKYCFHKFPSARITTVEIDDTVIALCEWFVIQPESERFQIVHADAARISVGQGRDCD